MPHQTFEIWQQFWESLPEPLRAAVLAGVVATLRIMYDDREPRLLRRLLEAALCGAIAFGIAAGLEAVAVPQGLATFLGAAVGLLGADKVREIGHRYVRRRMEESQ